MRNEELGIRNFHPPARQEFRISDFEFQISDLSRPYLYGWSYLRGKNSEFRIPNSEFGTRPKEAAR